MNLPTRDSSTPPSIALSPRAKSLGRALPYVTIALCCLIIYIAFTTLNHTDRSAAIIDGQDRQSAITACRAPYRSAIDSATLASSKAESHRFDVVTSLIVASIRGRIPPVTASRYARDLLLAQAAVAESQAQLDIAVRANASSAVMSGNHPKMFLAACHRAVPYKSCEQASSLGPTPLRAGDPGFSRKLDADGDGVACE